MYLVYILVHFKVVYTYLYSHDVALLQIRLAIRPEEELAYIIANMYS